MSGFTTEENSLILRNTTNQLVLSDPSFLGATTTISAPVPSASRIVSIPDVGSNSNVILSAGTNVMGGNYIFPTNVLLTQATNQLSVEPGGGTGPITTLNFTAPAANRVYTIPDSGTTAATLLLTQGSQTIVGSNTFSASTIFSATNNQITLWPGGSGNVFDINANTQGQGTTGVFYDPGTGLTDICLGMKNTVAVTGTTSLFLPQSGRVINVSNAGSAYSITLPTVTKGANYCIIITSTLNAAVTLAAGSAIICGSYLSSDGTSITGGNITSLKSNIIWGTGSIVGDTCNIQSADGVHWSVVGFTALHTSVSFS